MKVVGLITEYNPFHNGHLYHLNESKKRTNAEYSVAIMSGNFLQRGEPALVDKWTRAKMAIDNGVDLVIELPVVFACQSAEFFSYGAIKILDSLGIIDSICFGSELGDIKKLNYIADILHDEPDNYKMSLKFYLGLGYSYPKARQYALIDFLKESDFLDLPTINSIVSNPNNILSIEYLKSLKKVASSIKPFTLERIQADYHGKNLTGTISSATAIREQLINSPILEKINHTLPNITYKYLENFYTEHEGFNTINNFSQILLYLLRNSSKEDLRNIIDVNEGLDNRFIECSNKYRSIDQILDCISTKRYTMTRLKRILMHLLLNINRDAIKSLHSYGPQYIRILGLNTKGFEILNHAKKTSTLPIINKFADYTKIDNEILHQMIEIDKRATDIYSLGLKTGNNKANLDFTTTPYIKLDN